MRKTEEFNKLLLRYEAASLASPLKSDIFWRMREKAKSFSDWTAIFQYGDSSIRKDAQREMERLVLKGNDRSDIQLNILELFMVIDQGDKDEILRKYLKKFHEKDDLLFVLECADDGEEGYLAMQTRRKLERIYKRFGDLNRGLEARYKRSHKLLERSTFNP